MGKRAIPMTQLALNLDKTIERHLVGRATRA